MCFWVGLYFLKTFLLFHTVLLKCFIYSRVTVPYILHGITTPVAPTMNWGNVISILLIWKKFPFFQPKQKKNLLQGKSCLLNWITIIRMLIDQTINNICHGVDNCRLVKRSPASTNTLRFQNCSLMKTSLGKSPS